MGQTMKVLGVEEEFRLVYTTPFANYWRSGCWSLIYILELDVWDAEEHFLADEPICVKSGATPEEALSNLLTELEVYANNVLSKVRAARG